MYIQSPWQKPLPAVEQASVYMFKQVVGSQMRLRFWPFCSHDSHQMRSYLIPEISFLWSACFKDDNRVNIGLVWVVPQETTFAAQHSLPASCSGAVEPVSSSGISVWDQQAPLIRQVWGTVFLIQYLSLCQGRPTFAKGLLFSSNWFGIPEYGGVRQGHPELSGLAGFEIGTTQPEIIQVYRNIVTFTSHDSSHCLCKSVEYSRRL